MNFKGKLMTMRACRSAIDWVGYRTLEKSWEQCERGDWMLWLIHRANIDRMTIMSVHCKCLHILQSYISDARLLTALNIVEGYAEGETTESGLNFANQLTDSVLIDIRSTDDDRKIAVIILQTLRENTCAVEKIINTIYSRDWFFEVKNKLNTHMVDTIKNTVDIEDIKRGLENVKINASRV